MKIIVRSIYYEKDVYDFPERSLVTKPKKDEVFKSKAVLIYKKGNLKENRLTVDKYCCDEMEVQQGDSMAIRQEYAGFDWGPVPHKQKIPGCYLRVHRSYDDEPDYELIKYCPWCGEKIICKSAN